MNNGGQHVVCCYGNFNVTLFYEKRKDQKRFWLGCNYK